MKKIYKTSTKIGLTILCSLCAVAMLMSLFGTVAMAEFGIYNDNGQASVSERLYKRAGDGYALWAVANYHGGDLGTDFDIDFDGTGFKYGIVKGDEKDYVAQNFTGELPKDYRTAEFYVSQHPTYFLSNRVVEGNSYWAGETISAQDINVFGIGYDIIDDKTYIWDGEQFYPVASENAYPVDEGYYDDSNDASINSAFSHLWKNQASTQATEPTETTDIVYTVDDKEETTYVAEDEEASSEEETEVTYDYLPTETITTLPGTTDAKLLYLNHHGFHSMADMGWNKVLYIGSWENCGGIEAANVADLSEIHNELCKLENAEVQLRTPTIARAEIDNTTNVKYTVYYYTEGQPDSIGGYFHGNMFTQAAVLAKVIPVAMVACPFGIIIFFGLALWLLFLLFCGAGHRYGEDGVYPSKLDRVPMDLAFVIGLFIEMCLFYMIEAASYNTRFVNGAVGQTGWMLLVISIITFIGGVVGLVWLMTVAVNVKLGHWWQNTLIYKLLHVIKAWWSRVRLDVLAIRKSVRWDIRIWILFAVFVFLELFGLAALSARGELLFVWFLEKVLFGVALFFFLKHYAKIKHATLQMAEGDMTVAIDTDKMPLDLAEQGEALNKISSGMTTAVTERIKSERMKTELITNVSHDIKTPLTSIINYVDLLEKEQIDNDKAREYLEVLDRQAKRLKKLIEDLIEASKAATGNIKFNMESVNARTLLNQSIGEFVEKLEASQVTLVTNMPSEDVYLWADNRYLWRVFDNLMNNIAKYAQPGTRAYVDLKNLGDKVQFTFRNTSKNELNISADELMERFVRGDASRNTEGNGLGLSIARSLTESMEGTMNLAIDGDLFKVILEFKKQ